MSNHKKIITRELLDIQSLIRSKFNSFDEKSLADRPIKAQSIDEAHEKLLNLYSQLQKYLSESNYDLQGALNILEQTFGEISNEVLSLPEERISPYIKCIQPCIEKTKTHAFFTNELPENLRTPFIAMPKKAIEQIHGSQRLLKSSIEKNVVIKAIGKRDSSKNLIELDEKWDCFDDDLLDEQDQPDQSENNNQNFLTDESYTHQINKLLDVSLDGELGLRVDHQKSIHRDLSTVIPQKYPVIVPGGRFTECYYWDLYWMVRGLLVNNDIEIAQKVVKNFYSLVRQFGFVPNGARTYYLERSQPPF